MQFFPFIPENTFLGIFKVRTLSYSCNDVKMCIELCNKPMRRDSCLWSFSPAWMRKQPLWACRILQYPMPSSIPQTDGQIRISFHNVGRNLILQVWNTTDFISVGRHDELFERFYRADKSRNQKTGGFGIGLSVVYAIVNAHKGKITARSDDGTSLLFTITLSA